MQDTFVSYNGKSLAVFLSYYASLQVQPNILDIWNTSRVLLAYGQQRIRAILEYVVDGVSKQ